MGTSPPRAISARLGRAAAAICVAGLVAAAAAPAAAAAGAAGPAVMPRPAVNPPVPTLQWQPCNGAFQCATARVPLDYRHPDGTAISIAVLRHAATDPAHRIGSLFINGGGPAAQIDGLVAEYGLIPAVVRARYDIVTFDPRGFGYSTAIRCFPTVSAENTFLAGLPAFPVGTRQEAAWERTWARFDAVCAQRGGPLLGHDSTADVARDMDLVRQAVGDPVLNYWGLSYGTGLGATYANLFPARVGHMVLDGNLNPVAWTRADGTLTTHMRLNTDQASAATLAAFLDLCGKTSTAGCAFSAGTPAATRGKWNTLLRRLRAHPVTAGRPPQTYTYADVLASVPLGQVSQWQTGASQLQQLWAALATGPRVSTSAPTAATRQVTAFAGDAAPAQPAVYTGQEQLLGEFCADGPNPRDLRVYPALARLAYQRAGPIGPEAMWSPDEACAEWPATAGQDRYSGPWNRPTASPILVMGNTGDPRTAYQNSVAMSRDLARARLLTIDGYGHTEFLNPSTCATDYAIGYLLNGTLPAVGTVCQQDAVPFPLPGGRGT